MYANLKVVVHAHGDEPGRIISAYEVSIDEDGIVVQRDKQNGSGKYPEPDGGVILPRDAAITITASF